MSEKQSAALLEAQGEAKCCFARSARRSKALLCSKRKEKQSTALLEAKDIETGLHYNRYRYYEPHSARYIGKDPIGLEGGMNTSAYVSDPNAWIDALGLNSNFAYGGQIIGLSQQASSNLEYEASSNYDCWMKTGNICRIQKPLLFDYVTCSFGAGPLGGSRTTNLHDGNVIYTGLVSSQLSIILKKERNRLEKTLF